MVVSTDLCPSDNQALLRHAAAPIRRWSNSHYPFKQVLWDRVALIEKAIEHHLAGAYEASTPIILAQIDGMSRDLTGQSFFSKANADPYLDDATLAGMEENLPVVRRVSPRTSMSPATSASSRATLSCTVETLATRRE